MSNQPSTLLNSKGALAPSNQLRFLAHIASLFFAIGLCFSQGALANTLMGSTLTIEWCDRGDFGPGSCTETTVEVGNGIELQAGDWVLIDGEFLDVDQNSITFAFGGLSNPTDNIFYFNFRGLSAEINNLALLDNSDGSSVNNFSFEIPGCLSTSCPADSQGITWNPPASRSPQGGSWTLGVDLTLVPHQVFADVYLAGNADAPTLLLVNQTSEVAAVITESVLTIGDQQFNFDSATEQAAIEYVTAELIAPDDRDDAERTDAVTHRYDGFEASQIYATQLELDADSGESTEDYRSVLFNNGNAAAGQIMLTFERASSSGQGVPAAARTVVTQQLPDAPLASTYKFQLKGYIGLTDCGVANLPIASVDVPQNPARKDNLIDGSLAEDSFWRATGDTFFTLNLSSPAEVRCIDIATAANRKYRFDVYVDDLLAARDLPTNKLPNIERQRLVLPEGTMGSSIRIVGNRQFLRVNEAEILGVTTSEMIE